jgi:hypothetical protein
MLSFFSCWRLSERLMRRIGLPISGCCGWASTVTLVDRLWQEFRVSVSVQTLSRELRAMGYPRLSARPRHHAQAVGAIDAFKKTSPLRWQASRASRAAKLMQ